MSCVKKSDENLAQTVLCQLKEMLTAREKLVGEIAGVIAKRPCERCRSVSGDADPCETHSAQCWALYYQEAEDVLNLMQAKHEKHHPKITKALKGIDWLTLVALVFAQVLGAFFCILGGIIAVKTFIEML